MYLIWRAFGAKHNLRFLAVKPIIENLTNPDDTTWLLLAYQSDDRSIVIARLSGKPKKSVFGNFAYNKINSL